MGMIVKPFALTMRLAANMTGGHIAILALLSLMSIFADKFQSTVAGLGAALISVPMATAISGLEIIVVLVQAYVFTLLTAVFSLEWQLTFIIKQIRNNIMEPTTFLPIGLGLIVIGAAMGIGKFASSKLAESIARQPEVC